MISTGGEGKISARKRLRGKIGDPSTHPELKQFNLFDSSANQGQFYATLMFYGIYAAESTNAAGIWTPVACRWPLLSTGTSGRIGKRIRVKYLRIKGYVASSPFLMTQVRYRLVLYRSRKNLDGQNEVYNQAWLAGLYHKYMNMESNSANSEVMQKACAQNYYESFFDPDALHSRDCKRRVLFKGLLKPSPDPGNFRWLANDTGYLRTVPIVGANIDTITGQAAGSLTREAQFQTGPGANINLSGAYQLHNSDAAIATEVNSKAFFPIDITVNMNDNIDTWEYRYIFVLESDWAVGRDGSGNYDHSTAVSNFILSLTPQIYYTDD